MNTSLGIPEKVSPFSPFFSSMHYSSIFQWIFFFSLLLKSPCSVFHLLPRERSSRAAYRSPLAPLSYPSLRRPPWGFSWGHTVHLCAWQKEASASQRCSILFIWGTRIYEITLTVFPEETDQRGGLKKGRVTSSFFFYFILRRGWHFYCVSEL